MLSVINAECHIKALYAECHYAECRYAEFRSAIATFTAAKSFVVEVQEQLRRASENSNP